MRLPNTRLFSVGAVSSRCVGVWEPDGHGRIFFPTDSSDTDPDAEKVSYINRLDLQRKHLDRKVIPKSRLAMSHIYKGGWLYAASWSSHYRYHAETFAIEELSWKCPYTVYRGFTLPDSPWIFYPCLHSIVHELAEPGLWAYHSGDDDWTWIAWPYDPPGPSHLCALPNVDGVLAMVKGDEAAGVPARFAFFDSQTMTFEEPIPLPRADFLPSAAPDGRGGVLVADWGDQATRRPSHGFLRYDLSEGRFSTYPPPPQVGEPYHHISGPMLFGDLAYMWIRASGGPFQNRQLVLDPRTGEYDFLVTPSQPGQYMLTVYGTVAGDRMYNGTVDIKASSRDGVATNNKTPGEFQILVSSYD